jgi:tetratricopeptide (TPR) repeat protein
VKRLLLILGLSAVVAVGGAIVYQAESLDRSYRLLLLRGDTAVREGATFDAIEAYSGAVALRPDSMVAHLRRGQTYRARGELELASRDLRKAATLDPSAVRPRDGLGEVLYTRGRFARAAEVFEERLRLDDSTPGAAYNLALARYQTGELAGALAVLEGAQLHDVPNAAAEYLLALGMKESGRLRDAIGAMERAVAREPGLVAAREELADLYRVAGRTADEIEQLEVLAALDRDHIQRPVDVAFAQLRAGHDDLAVLTLGRALRRRPDHPAVIYGALGQVWLEMVDRRPDAIDKALEAFERAAASPNVASRVLTGYGTALVRAGQPAVAERILHQAMERYPIDPEAFRVYATLADGLGRRREARVARLNYARLSLEAPVTRGSGAGSGSPRR